jgi:hypothetical protein
MKRNYFIFTLLIYILEYFYITFIHNTVLFLNILFRYNTLLTNASKNILLISSIMFSVFLGPDEHLQVFECAAAVCLGISEDHLSSQHQCVYVMYF